MVVNYNNQISRRYISNPVLGGFKIEKRQQLHIQHYGVYRPVASESIENQGSSKQIGVSRVGQHIRDVLPDLLSLSSALDLDIYHLESIARPLTTESGTVGLSTFKVIIIPLDPRIEAVELVKSET